MLPNFNVVIGGIIVSIALLAATGASMINPQSYTRIGKTPEISRPVVQRMIADAEGAARFHILTVARRNEELGRLRELATMERAAEGGVANGGDEPAGAGHVIAANREPEAAAASGVGAHRVAEVAAAPAAPVPSALPSDAAGSGAEPARAATADVPPRTSAAAGDPTDHELTAALTAVPQEEAGPAAEIPAEGSRTIEVPEEDHRAASPPHIRRFRVRAVRASATIITHKLSFRHVHRGIRGNAAGGYGLSGNGSGGYNFSDYDYNGYFRRGNSPAGRRSRRYDFARYNFEWKWRSYATSR